MFTTKFLSLFSMVNIIIDAIEVKAVSSVWILTKFCFDTQKFVYKIFIFYFQWSTSLSMHLKWNWKQCLLFGFRPNSVLTHKKLFTKLLSFIYNAQHHYRCDRIEVKAVTSGWILTRFKFGHEKICFYKFFIIVYDR